MPLSAPGISSIHGLRAGILGAALVALLAGPASAQEPPTNLQVLPDDIPREQLTQVMRGFTAALGVRCSSCHVWEEGQPLSTYDFASDDKPMKVKARAMLRMSMDINNTYLAELPGRREPNVRVTCVTCHRGVRRPLPIEAVVQETMANEDLDFALQRYRELREEHYGGFAYDFTDGPLIGLATGMAQGNPEAALKILATNLEFHPGSASTLFALAQAYDTSGNQAAAIEHYRKVLEVQPDNGRAQRRLRELTGGA